MLNESLVDSELNIQFAVEVGSARTAEVPVKVGVFGAKKFPASAG
jgi:hypothetical protein